MHAARTNAAGKHGCSSETEWGLSGAGLRGDETRPPDLANSRAARQGGDPEPTITGKDDRSQRPGQKCKFCSGLGWLWRTEDC